VKKVFLGVGTLALILILLGGIMSKNSVNRKQGAFSFPRQEGCEGKALPEFTHHITDIEKLTLVQPGGGTETWQGKTIIKSHSYIVIDGEVPIYAPTDSVANEGVNYMEEGLEQYSVFFQVTCDVFYMFDHIHKPVEKLKKEFTKKPTEDTRTSNIGPVEFSAGELIGYTTGTRGAHHFDFGLYDTNYYHPYSNYKGVDISERDRWSVCPFDNFPNDKKKVYISLFGTLRTQDPIPTSICN
jgi:hypothetical protein